jgi:hypothetical protein
MYCHACWRQSRVISLSRMEVAKHISALASVVFSVLTAFAKTVEFSLCQRATRRNSRNECPQLDS